MDQIEIGGWGLRGGKMKGRTDEEKGKTNGVMVSAGWLTFNKLKGRKEEL